MTTHIHIELALYMGPLEVYTYEMDAAFLPASPPFPPHYLPQPADQQSVHRIKSEMPSSAESSLVCACEPDN